MLADSQGGKKKEQQQQQHAKKTLWNSIRHDVLLFCEAGFFPTGTWSLEGIDFKNDIFSARSS